MLVAGVDGCPAGWIVVFAETNGSLRLTGARNTPDFAGVLRKTADCAAVAIDVPIGLSENSSRVADLEARRILSPFRHSSVFPAPIRSVLGAPTYREACDISARNHVRGKKISKQTYFLTLRIAEVDRLMEPALQDRVIEVHPEVCFWALNGQQPMPTAKRLGTGEQERVELLSTVFYDDLQAQHLPTGADRDDFYDACAAAWTAARFARGEHSTLPEEPPRDRRGLRMEIVY